MAVTRSVRSFDPPIVRRAMQRRVRQARARATWCGTRSCSSCSSAACSRRSCSSASDRAAPRRLGLHAPARALALVHGAVRQLRRGDGRGARQGAGRHAAQDRARQTPAKRLRGSGAITSTRRDGVRRATLRARRPGPVHARATSFPATARSSRASPRWTSRRSPASRAPVIRESRRRPLGGHRRHQGALRLARRPDHGESRRDVPRPHDRAGRGRHRGRRRRTRSRSRSCSPGSRSSSCSPSPRCSRSRSTAAAPVAVPILIALLVCLIPTTIGGLLSAIGIAGMDRLIQHNVIAMSGRAVEAAGDVNTLLLDKTGTITLGNRQAVEFVPAARRRAPRSWPIARSSPRCPTRRPKGAASSCWPRRSTASAAAR